MDDIKDSRLQQTVKAAGAAVKAEAACQELEQTIRAHLLDVLGNCYKNLLLSVTVESRSERPFAQQSGLSVTAHLCLSYKDDQTREDLTKMDRKVERLFSDFGLPRMKIRERRTVTKWKFQKPARFLSEEGHD